MSRKRIYHQYMKRVIDLILALIGIVILSPVLLVVALLVRINLGSPVIFKQKRVGKDEKIFEIYKFRTMTDEKDEKGELLDVTIRLTKFGQKLRLSSLDELPELFNILKGDMSLVGPRPLLVHYLPYYTEEERHRHSIRPGLTGLAQINGRNLLSWEEKFAFDLKYIQGYSFLMDLNIIFATIKKVFTKEDIVRFEEGEFSEERENQLQLVKEGK